ncbi:suppressor of fused domain protein [bacterium SCSIO 12643]|nr:suppressor of fused domain protein [bacterium SCSIO 12643]
MSHLDRIFQVEPEFFSNDSIYPELNGVTSIVYKDIPEKGMITALTYGLSLINHPDWKYGRPELLISVDSDDVSWGQVVGFLANKLRGDCSFSYGETINFGKKISDSSEMDAFFVFAPSILEREDYLDVDIGLDYKINIIGLYPMYASEMELINNWGLEKFWHHSDFDNYDVNRKRVEE